MPEVAAARPARISMAWAIALLVTCVCALVPFAPAMPGEGLDLSWSAAMNQAAAQGLAFGRDLAFTLGPYASVDTRMFHPATDARMLWASAALAVALAAVLVHLLREGWLARGALLLLLSGVLYSLDAVHIAYMVAAGLLCERLSKREQAAAAPRTGGSASLLLFLLFAPLGLLPLVKGSLLGLAGTITVLACMLCLLRRQPWMALAVVLGPLAGAAASWQLAGQRLRDLGDYVAAMLPMVSGYTEAMSSTGKPGEVLLYLVAAIAMAWRLARRDAPWADRLLVLLMVAAGLFLAFKAGFVRHDAHAGTAGLFLLFACCILPWPRGRAGNVVTVGLALLTWVSIDQHYFHSGPERIAVQVQRTYSQAWSGLRQRITAPESLAASYRATMLNLADRATFGRLQGSTDVYSHAQIELIAPGNTWNPRPVFQSYSAYTPELAERNREHLVGPRAPDQVVFRVEAIDDRLPPQEDGPSWPELLARYEPADLRADALLLRKRATPRALPECDTATAEHALGEDVRLPGGDCAAFVRLDLRPSLLGTLAALVYKPSQLEVRLQLVDGTSREYRVVSGMARAGFLLSPLVEDAADFGLLYAGAEQLAYKDVRSLTVTARKTWMWKPTYTLELRRLRLPRESAVLRLYGREPPPEAIGARIIEPAVRCMASLDVLNGVFPQKRFSAGRVLSAYGWLATAGGEVAAPVFLVLTDASGKHLLVPARRVPRPDVADHFGQPALAGSGFRATANVESLRGPFRLTLGYEEQGRIRTCPEVDVRGLLSGAP